jgi:DHA2 family multidrug resistance protein-like MFS transporter
VTARDPRRWWILAAVVLAMLAIGLDVTVLSVALPTLATDLHASTGQLQWFVAGYALVLPAALLPGGLLGDRYGRRRILLIAMAIFGAGSVACAYAPSAGAFLAARVLAGLGAALAVPVSLSMLTVLFDPDERPRAVGMWAAANFLALPIGPILGGWLLTHYWWGWVFLVNVPVVLLGMLAVTAWMPESRGAHPPALDATGVLLSSTGLAVLTYGFIRAGDRGWGDLGALASMVAGAAVLVAFAGHERRLSRRSSRLVAWRGTRRAGTVAGRGGEPLVDPALFASARFTWGTVVGGFGVFAMVGVLFTAPQYFQAVQGTDAMASGVRLLPLIAGVVVGAVGADRLAARAGAKFAVGTGFALLAGALAVGARTAPGTGFGFVAGWMCVAGAGMGLVLATGASAALGALSAERAGVGSAVMQAVQKVGAPLGAAALGSVLNAGYRHALHLTAVPAGVAAAARDGVFAGTAVAARLGSPALLADVRAAFVHGMDDMLWACGAVAVVGLVVGVSFLPGRADPARSDPGGTEQERARVG